MIGSLTAEPKIVGPNFFFSLFYISFDFEISFSLIFPMILFDNFGDGVFV